jgi:hypothetical protein
LTVDTLVIVIPVAVKQQGSVGTRSPLGVVEYDDSVYFPIAKRFPQHRLTAVDPQRARDQRLVRRDPAERARHPTPTPVRLPASPTTAVFTGRSRTDPAPTTRVFVYDKERKGAWALPWTLAVKRFFEYTDSGGTIHLLAVPVTGTKLIEIGGSGSGDSGTAFQTILESGIIHFDKNHMTWAYVSKAYVELADPAGDINFGVSGTRRGKSFNTLKTRTISAQQGSGGFGADLWADILFGDTIPSSVTYAQPSIKKVINIKKCSTTLKWPKHQQCGRTLLADPVGDRRVHYCQPLTHRTGKSNDIANIPLMLQCGESSLYKAAPQQCCLFYF